MVVVVLMALIVLGTATGLVLYVTNLSRQTRRYIASTEALNAAESGLHRAFFRLQATNNWTGVLASPTIGWTLLSTNRAEYTATLTGVVSNEASVVAMGRQHFGGDYVYRKIEAKIKRRLPRAFEYTMFGEKVGFHNHMKQNYGLTINSKVWSNTDIVLHRGLVLNGDFTAVGQISMLNTPQVSATTYSGEFRDGMSSSPFFAAKFDDPIPEPIPFPSYDFEGAKKTAMGAGTYFASEAAFLSYIAARTTNWTSANRKFYAFPSPLPANSGRTIPLVDATMKLTGIVQRAEIDSSIFYVADSVSLKGPPNSLLILRGGLVVEGSVTIARPMELYAKSTTPAIAATGKIDVTDTDPTDGTGGPFTMEGIIYTMSDCHIHQSHPYNAVSAQGIEVASYIHNCEWFSFTYKAWPGVMGFSEGEGGEGTYLTKWREVPVD